MQFVGKWRDELKSLYPNDHFDSIFEAFYTYFHTKIDGFVFFSIVSKYLVLFLNVCPGHNTYDIFVLIFWCLKLGSFDRYQKHVGPTCSTDQILTRFLPKILQPICFALIILGTGPLYVYILSFNTTDACQQICVKTQCRA